MKSIFILLLSFLLIFNVFGSDSPLINHMKDVTVLVESQTTAGTGLLINHGTNTYVLTAAHVVKPNVEKGGFLKPDKLKSVKIFKTNFDINDNLIETIEVSGDIIKYSYNDYDLALIKIKKSLSTGSVIFDLETDLKIGMETWNCGNYRGRTGSYSVGKGMVSYKNRIYFDKNYVQVSNVILFGNSGGGIFLTNQKCVGIVSLKFDEGFTLSVGIDRITKFAQEYDCLGILYPTLSINEKTKIE